jgi:hypothetical protein
MSRAFGAGSRSRGRSGATRVEQRSWYMTGRMLSFRPFAGFSVPDAAAQRGARSTFRAAPGPRGGNQPSAPLPDYLPKKERTLSMTLVCVAPRFCVDSLLAVWWPSAVGGKSSGASGSPSPCAVSFCASSFWTSSPGS